MGGGGRGVHREDLHVHSGTQVSKDKVTIVRTGGGWEPAEFAQMHQQAMNTGTRWPKIIATWAPPTAIQQMHTELLIMF